MEREDEKDRLDALDGADIFDIKPSSFDEFDAALTAKATVCYKPEDEPKTSDAKEESTTSTTMDGATAQEPPVRAIPIEETPPIESPTSPQTVEELEATPDAATATTSTSEFSDRYSDLIQRYGDPNGDNNAATATTSTSEFSDQDSVPIELYDDPDADNDDLTNETIDDEFEGRAPTIGEIPIREIRPALEELYPAVKSPNRKSGKKEEEGSAAGVGCAIAVIIFIIIKFLFAFF